MQESFTQGALRALEHASALARERGAATLEPIDLLRALVDETESHAATLLAEFGLDPDRMQAALAVGIPPAPATDAASDGPLPYSPELRTALHDATTHAKTLDRSRPVGTENLLAALLVATPTARLLEEIGLDTAPLLDRLAPETAADTAPIPLAPEIAPLQLVEPSQAVDLARILDASANRAREGLRVVEDYVRFVLNDPGLTRRLKEVRHRLGEAIRGFDPELLLAARDTRGDVGTHIMTDTEQARENPRAVLIANFKRTGEALRTLEEYSKLIDVWISGRFEVLRYDLYTLEKLTIIAVNAARILGNASLQVLVGGLPTLGDLTWVVGEALAGGADVIQLREKNIPDREWLTRAREVRILTAQARARFIVNDRPDLARLASADGVHLGQDDVTVRDARRVLGSSALIGVSTHNREQLEQAIVEGAGYLGVGPVFSSTTKSFADLAGLSYVRSAAESTTLPWFAIGGITEDNVDQVLEAGATRIAVSSAVVRAERPRQAAAAFRARLDAMNID